MSRRGDEKKYYRCEIRGFHRGVNRSSVFWDVTQRRLIVSDVSGRQISQIFRGHADREVSSQTSWPVKVGPIGCPKTSVTTNQRCVGLKCGVGERQHTTLPNICFLLYSPQTPSDIYQPAQSTCLILSLKFV